MAMTRFERMGGSRTAEQEELGVKISRSRGDGNEMEEMQKLFEQYMGGEQIGGEEGEEEVNWEEMWNTVMGEEEGFDEYGGQEQQQGSQYPTMFGGFNRPGGVKYPSSPGFNFY